MQNKNRYNFVFVLPTNIGFGAGGEIVVQSYVKYLKEIDKNLKITIVQTDWMGTSNNKPVDKLSDVDVITFKSPYSMRIYKLLGQTPLITNIIKYIYPFFYIILNNKKIRLISKESDVIYFVLHNDILPWSIFNSNIISKTISGGHGGFFHYKGSDLSIRGILNKIKFKLFYKYPFALHYLTKKQMLEVGRNGKYDFILPNGVDTDKFYPINRNNVDTKFVYFGRLDKYKGILELLEAFKKYPFNDSILTIIGTGELGKIVESQKSQNVRYLGYIDRETLYKEIPNHDIFVFPTYGETYGETFGMVVIEAVSSGLFCLVSDKQKGIFDDLESIGAIEYIPNTVDGILQAMIKYHGFKVPYEKKLEWHKFIKEHYDWKDISIRLYEKLKEIAEINK
jgi:glycosyltransferase involved in cell wall biosynthesis